MLEEILTVEEVAEYLKLSKATIWRWCQSGKLPAFRLGHQWRIHGGELQKLINANTMSPKAEGEERGPS